MKYTCLLVLTIIALSFQAPQKDLVTSLPGWDKELYSNLYSGFIPSGDDGTYSYHQYYMFFESENDPKNDPVIVWTNGGPGAASVYGLFVEMGPYQFSEESMKSEGFNKTGIPTMYRNPSAWTTFANVLIINSGGPTAWSYCEPAGPSGGPNTCGDWNDTKTAWVNANYLEGWAKEYPEYLNNEWFIAGESYAGIYVPTLVKELQDRNSTLLNNLKGFACGDACTGASDNFGQYYEVKFLNGHGQFSDKLNDQIMATCNFEDEKAINNQCQTLLNEMDDQVGGYWGYGLYDTCWYERIFDQRKYGQQQSRNYWSSVPQNYGGALNDYPCGGNIAMVAWVNQTAVKKALKVPEDAYFFSADNGEGFVYNCDSGSVFPIYQNAVLNTSLRVLVYNGDTDPGLNSFYAEHWTSNLGFKEIQEWSPWTIDGRQYMGGYVTRYEHDFNYLTIRGSGHMVPLFKPKEAHEFMKKWVLNEDWQPYVKPSIRQ